MARCRCMLACRVSRGVTGTSIRRASQRKLCQRGARNGAPGHVTSETGRVGLIDVCQTSQHRARLGSRGCLVLPASLPASRGQVEASRTRSSPTCSAITAGSSTASRAACSRTGCASSGRLCSGRASCARSPLTALCRSGTRATAVHCADPYVPGPPYCTYRLRVPASCVVAHVPEAQGSCWATVRTTYMHMTCTCTCTCASLGRAVRTTYRGTTGGAQAAHLWLHAPKNNLQTQGVWVHQPAEEP